MSPKRKKTSELVQCGNPTCRHRMLADGYSATIPPDAAPERIHREYHPDQPMRTVMCTCGHYTQHSPFPPKAP